LATPDNNSAWRSLNLVGPLSASTTEQALMPRRAFGVTYGPIDDLPFADVDAWEDLGLPVVSPRAYPLAADLANDGTMRRLNAAELAAADALLRALVRARSPDFV